MVLIAVDPGVVTGFAFFVGGKLLSAKTCSVEEFRMLIENETPLSWQNSRKPHESVCVIELPQIYPGQQQKGDQNDLITLAVAVGRYVEIAKACGFQTRLVKPREWKGQLPKDVCWSRVKDTLSFEELARIPKLPKSRAHNMHDAIGIGTWFLKRWR